MPRKDEYSVSCVILCGTQRSSGRHNFDMVVGQNLQMKRVTGIGKVSHRKLPHVLIAQVHNLCTALRIALYPFPCLLHTFWLEHLTSTPPIVEFYTLSTPLLAQCSWQIAQYCSAAGTLHSTAGRYCTVQLAYCTVLQCSWQILHSTAGR